MRRSPALRRIIPAIAVGALVLAACGSDDDSGDSADDTTAPADTTDTSDATDAGDADAAVDCTATIEDGVLTIATGEPAFFPWVLDDAPESGEGFEAAVAYAVAAEMGYEADAGASADPPRSPGVQGDGSWRRAAVSAPRQGPFDHVHPRSDARRRRDLDRPHRRQRPRGLSRAALLGR